MGKQSAGTLLPLFESATVEGQPLYRQLYAAIREGILRGDLKLGIRLPSTRTLGRELGLSRNTVMSAFEQLHAEGYLDCRTGAGSFVVGSLAESLRKTHAQHTGSMRKEAILRARLARRGQAMLDAWTPETPAGSPRAFIPGIPALDAFPHRQWNRCVRDAASKLDQAALNYGPSGGYLPLRKALAAYLAAARGVRCEAQQILLVSGVQQGLDLITRLLTDPGDPVWIEEPGHPGARGVFMAGQTRLIPVPVDNNGLDIDEGIRRCPVARLAYVTPSHQSPGGVLMSLSRRMQLLEWARQSDAWLIEDDYDSEFRYKGRPIAALQGLTEDARVLYLGTFSKVLAPGMRLAYLVVPDALVEVFCAGRRLLDTHSPIPLQIAMTKFIEEGYFTSHIRRMRRLYEERQDSLLAAVKDSLMDWVTMSPSASGMHLIGYLRQGRDTTYSELAASQGISVPPLSNYYIGNTDTSGLLFGYACVTPERITAAVRQLARIFSQA